MDQRIKFINRIIKASLYLRYVPYIKMLGLNGSMIRGEEKGSSDIDFLIIAKHKRLYTARFFATFLAEMTGYRRKGNKVAGRVCLNCYLSDKNLKIAPVHQKSRAKVATAYKYLIALIDEGDIEKGFFEANGWFSGYKVKGSGYSKKLRSKLLYLINGRSFRTFSYDHKIRPLTPMRWGEWLLTGKFGDWVEKKLMDYQVKRILAGKKEGDEIVCKKNEIRLHPRKFVKKVYKVKSL